MKLLNLAIVPFAATLSASAPAVPTRCEALASLELAQTSLTAVTVPAGFIPPRSIFDGLIAPAPMSKPFCRIRGVIAPAIKFELWLPETHLWNGRLQGVGGGGMAGAIPFPSLADGLHADFATAGSDLGHESDFFTADWAIGHPEKIVDWGHRATHEMTVRAKTIIAVYYRKPLRRSYFTGCSGGGRQGLMEAQRYPADYDGILAGNPTLNFTHLTLGGRLWVELTRNWPGPGKGHIPAAKIPLLAAGVLSACDKLDGVIDGVLEDPRLCHFDPAELQCRGKDRGTCLTRHQVTAVRRIYAGSTNSRGESVFPGYERGGELGAGGWANFVSGEGPVKRVQWQYASAFLKGMVFEDPGYDPARFNFDRDVLAVASKPVLGETLARTINADDADLTAFKKRGGRILHYHGWSDPAVAPRSSIQYYERVVDYELVLAKTGETYIESLARTRGFYRLFMVPGLQHCAGGPGTTKFDGLQALQDWVERGQAPNAIIARREQRGQVARTRPLCPYPQKAVWRGHGDTDRADSFKCR